MRVLEMEDVITLLRAEVSRAGSQLAWAQAAGVDRSVLSMVLRGRRPPPKKILRALKLRMVFVPAEPKIE